MAHQPTGSLFREHNAFLVIRALTPENGKRTTMPDFSAEWVALTTAAIISLAAFSVLWTMSLRREDASIVDWYWALGFGVFAGLYLAIRDTDLQSLCLALFTIAWSLRLTVHLVRRHAFKGVEDARYAAMRAAGGSTFKRDSLFKIFWLQAVFQWLIATPLHAGMLFGDGIDRGPLFALGSLVFIVGALIEAIADAQLDRFSRDRANAGKLLTTGLFAWSRHPNYFGEAVLWWGLGLIGFALSGLWWSFVGPAILTLLLVKVSGVPPLDQHLSSRPGWKAYAARTPAIIPRMPRAERAETKTQINP
jgi:steroid 5-alpha reductase family enzyme